MPMTDEQKQKALAQINAGLAIPVNAWNPLEVAKFAAKHAVDAMAPHVSFDDPGVLDTPAPPKPQDGDKDPDTKPDGQTDDPAVVPFKKPAAKRGKRGKQANP